jgi:serine/threonine-protein kinase
MLALKIGSTVKNQFEIVARHGRGVLGTEVFLGRDKKTGGDVMIRVLSSVGDADTLDRFKQSAEIAKTLRHPNILPVIDTGEENGVPYMVTAKEKGFFLDDYLEHRGSLDEKESLLIVKSLSEALDYAWNERKIIHRDISPDTIFIAKGNVPKLTDFDLAKSLEKDQHLTMTGFTVGNPYYMSPEQACGEDVDSRSDIYCLGLVFYQLLTGSGPFADKSKQDALKAQLTEKPPSARSKNSDISDACSTVLEKMLEKDASKRHQSWSELMGDLDAVIQGAALPSSRQSFGSGGSSDYKMRVVQMPAAQIDSSTAVIAPAEEKTPNAPSPSSKASWKKTVPAALALGLVVFGIAIAVHLSNRDGGSPSPRPPAKPISAPPPPERHVPKPPPPADTAKVELPPAGETSKPAEPTEPKTASTPPEKPTKHVEEKTLVRKICLDNTKKIGEALQMYSNVFDGKFPEPDGVKGLKILLKRGFVKDPKVFACPGKLSSAKPGDPLSEETCDYAYRGGLSEASSNDTPILWSKPANHPDYGTILYVNGEIKSFAGENWEEHTKLPAKKSQ